MKYVFGVLAALLLVIVGILFFVRGGDEPAQQVKTQVLTDYAGGNSRVVFTTYGRLVGEDERRSVRVTVTPVERRIEVLGGYNENVIKTETFQNNQAAYENFLSALQRSGFTSKRSSSIEDPRGVCPSGRRFEYRLVSDGNDVSNLWSNSCDKAGTFAGASTPVRTLFEAQIPEYSKQIQGVRL